MRSLIIGFVILLAGCNQGTNNVPYSDPALVAKVDNLTKALAAATHETAQIARSTKRLNLVGTVNGVATAERVLAIGQAAVITPNFGPCTDLGIMEGQEFISGNGPLGALYQAFHNCTGNHTEYNPDTGIMKTANRVYFTSPDCSGTEYQWQAGGAGYDSQTLNDGLVYVSPFSGKDMWVQPGQTIQMVQAGSVYIVANGACSTDADFQPMWVASNNDVTKTGFPLNVGQYHLSPL